MQALIECEGESIDLSGDMGAVGRMVIMDTPSRNHEMFLDLKGNDSIVTDDWSISVFLFRSII